MTREPNSPVPPTQGLPSGRHEPPAGEGDDLALARGCIHAVLIVAFLGGLLSFTAGVMLRAVQP